MYLLSQQLFDFESFCCQKQSNVRQHQSQKCLDIVCIYYKDKNDNIIQYYDNYSSNCIFNHIQRHCVDYFAFVSDPFKIILENQADEKKSAFFKMISFWIKKI